MNITVITGRLTREPELRHSADGLAIASLTVAVERGKDKNGNDKGADFPRVQTFGRTAENCAKYLHKGSLIGVRGRIQTGSYVNKNGDKVYTTDIAADNVEFLEKRDPNKAVTAPAAPVYGNGGSNAWEDIDDGSIPF